MKFLDVKFPDRIGDGRHLAELPAQTIRATGMLLIQDQLRNTFDYCPWLYVTHSAAHSTLILSIRSLGEVSLVSQENASTSLGVRSLDFMPA